MSDFFLGEIRMFSFGWPPRGWALCNGSVLPINQYQALFSLLGTQYGGNGTTTFALPDLRGRAPLSAGLDTANDIAYSIGSPGGSETVLIDATMLPSHTHAVAATTVVADKPTPAGASSSVQCLIAAVAPDSSTAKVIPNYYGPPGNPVGLAPGSLTPTGGSTGHANLQPFLVTNFCIATTGLYPSRS